MPDSPFVAHLTPRLPELLTELAVLSAMDCGTYDKAGVDAVGRLIRVKAETRGATVATFDGGELGDSLVATWRGTGTARVLLVGHLDTVYPRDWPTGHPFIIEGDRARGPGTADMKGGLLTGLYALDALRAAGFADFAEIAFVFNSDEEIGSPSSTALIRRVAEGRDAVLVLEPGRANGNIVSARKGMGTFELTVTGQAAHAGVDPEKGRSAILELAHQTVALHTLSNLPAGITVNVGTVNGGTRGNVVAAEAVAKIDLRARAREDLETTIAAMHRLAANVTVPGTTASLTGAIGHQPMARTEAIAHLVALCQESARAAGFTVEETATGGGSDGNTTAAMGVPTLDGLGPVGGGAHSPDEYLEVSSLVPRAAMLAGLITKVCKEKRAS
ncbi:MAG TPA: M20 family metallopeptidase [Chloroflexota bacterium]|nr:M20 family metallopeptidase [Chloroflexota bacterium]